ncbi:hypothetical protein [Thermosphaera sp.]
MGELFQRNRSALTVEPAAYAEQVRRCKAAAESATGRPCKGLRLATFVRSPESRWSRSLRQQVAVLPDTDHCGEWVPGRIRIAVRERDGTVPDQVVIHEIAHQIAYDHGLDRHGVVHCPEFRGKIWGWI